MGTFHILTDVIFVRSDIYQSKSAVRKNVFSYSKNGTAPVWLDIENYSSTFYLVIFSEEVDIGINWFGDFYILCKFELFHSAFFVLHSYIASS